MTPQKGHPGQHAYTFLIRILSTSLSPQIQFSLSAVTLGIYLGEYNLLSLCECSHHSKHNRCTTLQYENWGREVEALDCALKGAQA
jgi:hypothetical protein